jgi:hypothetical protein
MDLMQIQRAVRTGHNLLGRRLDPVEVESVVSKIEAPVDRAAKSVDIGVTEFVERSLNDKVIVRCEDLRAWKVSAPASHDPGEELPVYGQGVRQIRVRSRKLARVREGNVNFAFELVDLRLGEALGVLARAESYLSKVCLVGK